MNNFTSGIHVLVCKEDRFLLVKRNEDDIDDPGCWDLIGGGVDYKEQPLDAAIREAKEEAGIEIRIEKILAVWGMQDKDNWSIEIIALGKYLGGDIKLSKEHTGYKWVNKKELNLLNPKSIHLRALFRYSSGR